MLNEDIFVLIKKLLRNKKFWAGFFTSLFTTLIVIGGVGYTVWHYRAEVFDYFANEYMSQSILSDDIAGAQTEKIIEKQSIFTQERFVVDAVKKTNPAVVSIVITKEVPTYETYLDPNQSRLNELFPGFFFNIPQYRQNGTEKKEIGGGSGFLVSSDGLIVTNRHVVDQKDVEYTVFTNNGAKHNATVLARDSVLDIAILKIEKPAGAGYPYLSLGDSDKLEIGQSVIAIGNALAEFRNTVSVGVISGLARSITAGDSYGNTELLDQVIQTDAAINPGNSGGPLLDLSGKVIGVNVAVAQGSQNIGFALPINSIKGVIESVKATGKIVRPYLGVRYIAINKEIQQKNNLSVDYGIIVKAGSDPSELAVIPGSPANKAGIVENDIILELNGQRIDENHTLASLIRQSSVGEKINLKILHKGETKYVATTLESTTE